MAVLPIDGQTYYFIDKCLCFGAAISCAHFQHFLDAVAHIMAAKTGFKPPNYLDDFLFVAMLASACNKLVEVFLEICQKISFPVSMEKTVWRCTSLTFLGLLIDTIAQVVLIPVEKIEHAKTLILDILTGKSTTVRKLQKLTGFLNFLCHCIVPGRAFTRRLYFYFTLALKPYHHVQINKEIRQDLDVWLQFLNNPIIYCRTFIDYSEVILAQELFWYTDASGVIGMGGICGKSWFSEVWDLQFIHNCKPSIEYLELWAVTASVLLWSFKFRNKRVCLFCNNQAVVQMINNATSSCKNCMKLIRIITLHSLELNIRIFAKFVETKKNQFADALSRNQLDRFWRHAELKQRKFNKFPDSLPELIWPVNTTIWQYRSGMVNLNMVNLKFHLIRSYYEIFFYHSPNISCLKCTVNSNFHLIRSKTLLTNDFELTIPNL